ncbi:Fc.00g099210.m01.CDS01 [Cosmosporella sp. VM-42]
MYGKWLGYISIIPLARVLGIEEDGINCSPSALEALIERNAVPFDADIAGLGVLIGFLFTAVLAFDILIVAYATYSIPLRLINEVDAVMARVLRKWWRYIRDKLHLSRLQGRTMGTDKRDDRIKTFTTFLLSLSDQILVSEVAILVAAFVGFREITVYSINIIIALGCLASTVHLATLPLLIERLTKHKNAKAMRVIIMVIGSGMLIFFLIIQLSSSWYESVYLQCGVMDFSIDVTVDFFVNLTVPVGVLYGTVDVITLLYSRLEDDGYREQEDRLRERRADGEDEGRIRTHDEDRDDRLRGRDHVPDGQEQPARCDHQRNGETERCESQDTEIEVRQDTNRDQRRDAVRGRDEVIELRQLRSVDIERRLSVSREQSRTASPSPPQAQDGTENQNERGKRDPAGKGSGELKNFYNRWKQADRSDLSRQWLRLRASEILQARISVSSQRRYVIRLAEDWAFHECQGSFMWRMLWLWSGNVYGIAAVFTAQSETTGMSGNPYKMGFGQIVPLALLLLPMFAAVQSLADYWEEIRNYVQNTEQSKTSAEDRILLTGSAHRNNHPSLLKWSEGETPTSCGEARKAIFLHTGFMALFATAFGLFLAVDFAPAGVSTGLFFVMLLIEVRKLGGACHLFVFTFRNNRNFETNSQRQRTPGDQAQRMMMANGADDVAQEPEETV